jgi:hypothetical protein
VIKRRRKLPGAIYSLALGMLALLLMPATAVAGELLGGSVLVQLVPSQVTVSNIGTSSATISWETNGDATSQVFFDTQSHINVSGYARQSALDSTMVALHTVPLTGLSSFSTYHYRVQSVATADSTEFVAVSPDYTFTTLPGQDGNTSHNVYGGSGGGLPLGTTPVFPFVTKDGIFTETLTASSTDGRAWVTIDEGTQGLTGDGRPLGYISITPMTAPPPPPPGYSTVGLPYIFGPGGATFDPPLTITFSYDPPPLPEGSDEDRLTVAIWDVTANSWLPTVCVVHRDTHTVTAQVAHFSLYELLIPSSPATFGVSNLSISPSSVDIGNPVTISVTVTNTGDLAGTYKVSLKINNVEADASDVSLASKASQTVNFATSGNTGGTYTVDVNGQAGSFTVEAAPTPTPPPTPVPTPTPTPVNRPLIGGIIAAVVVIGVVVWLVVIRRRRKQA